MENAIKISNHPVFVNRIREVVVESDRWVKGQSHVDDQNEINFSGNKAVEFGFRIFYAEIINSVKVRDKNSRTLFYSASNKNKIGVDPSGLIYIDDVSHPMFAVCPTEVDFLFELKETNGFTIGGERHSLPKVPDGNGGEREMNTLEIQSLFIDNLDKRTSGSIFKE